MPDDLIPILTRFHQEIVGPDIQRIVGTAVEASERRLRDEMQTGFDGLAQRFDRLDTEYHMLVAGLKRVEERLDAVEQRLDGVEQRLSALEVEHRELATMVKRLEERLRGIEARVEERAAGPLAHGLTAEMTALRSRIDGLDERLQVLEKRLQG